MYYYIRLDDNNKEKSAVLSLSRTVPFQHIFTVPFICGLQRIIVVQYKKLNYT